MLTANLHLVKSLGILLFGLVIGRNVPREIEGRDFFYNAAEGRKSSCSDFCDKPTDYEVTCKLMCKDYIPKERAMIADDNLIDTDDNTHNGYIFFIVATVIVAVVFTVLAVIFRSKLQRQFEDLHERLCGRLVNAETETGNGPSAQALLRPVETNNTN